MPRQPVKANRVHRFEDLKAPGDFLWSGRPGSLACEHLTFVCPCGCGAMPGVVVIGPKAWAWDRNEDSPTITPSIRRLEGCEWHGYLTDGEFREC